MQLGHNRRLEEMFMTRIRLAAILLGALVLDQAGVASSARAAEPAWSQKEVTGLAANLSRVLGDTAAAAREAPPQATVLQQRTRDDALRSFNRVREAADDYLAKLRKGWDRDLTESYFRALKRQFRDARGLARDAVPTKTVDEKLSEAEELIEKLSRFYPNA